MLTHYTLHNLFSPLLFNLFCVFNSQLPSKIRILSDLGPITHKLCLKVLS